MGIHCHLSTICAANAEPSDATIGQTSETTTLSGFITDIDGEPLAGAVVRIDGTSLRARPTSKENTSSRHALKKEI